MTDHRLDATWFLAQFKPNSYRIAERNLVLQAFQTFLPLHDETRRARQVHHPDAPALPRLFVRGLRYRERRLAQGQLHPWHYPNRQSRQRPRACTARSGPPADAAL